MYGPAKPKPLASVAKKKEDEQPKERIKLAIFHQGKDEDDEEEKKDPEKEESEDVTTNALMNRAVVKKKKA